MTKTEYAIKAAVIVLLSVLLVGALGVFVVKALEREDAYFRCEAWKRKVDNLAVGLNARSDNDFDSDRAMARMVLEKQRPTDC